MEGVTPTVSLGAALLIFIGVGVFAVAIAQAFQMVSHSSENTEHLVSRSENMFTMMRTIWTLPLTQVN